MVTASNRPDAVAARLNLLEQKFESAGGPGELERIKAIVIEKADQTVGGSSGNITMPSDGLERAELDNVFKTYGGSLFKAVFGPPTASIDPYNLVAGYLQGYPYHSFYDEFRALFIRVDDLEDTVAAQANAISDLQARVLNLETQ